MTDLGTWKDSSESDDTPRWMLVAVGALLVSLVAVVVVLVVHGPVQLAKATTGPTAAAVVHPEKWDLRIAPYAKIAQKKRGLRFEHPVAVRFLPPAKFEKTLTTERTDLNAEDRAEIENTTGLMRAFGLIDGDVDLFDAYQDLATGSVLAYYSFDDERITIRGKRLRPAVRATLVHELTHALQDQHFGIGARMEELSKKAKGASTSAVETVLDAVVEGDAQRVEALYRDSLTGAQRAALDSGEAGQNAKADKRLTTVPPALVALMSAPYVLGEALAQTVAADGGNAAVNELLTSPPANEQVLLDPFRAVSGDTEALEVDVPKLAEGERKFEFGEFGTITWYMMLAQRIPLRDALTVVNGWAGDAYVGFERDGQHCARMTYVGRSKAAARSMSSALERWIAAAPGSPASVSHKARTVTFESCDPGPRAPRGNDTSADAITLSASRTYIGLGLLNAGAPPTVARCVAGRIVDAFTLSQLNDPTFGADDLAVQARVQGFAAACRS